MLDQAQIQSVQANLSALVTSNQTEFPKTAALLRRGKGEFVALDTIHPTFLVILAKHLTLCDKLALFMRKSAEEWMLSGAGPLARRFRDLCDPEMASLLDSTFASLVEQGLVTMSLTPLESAFGIFHRFQLLVCVLRKCFVNVGPPPGSAVLVATKNMSFLNTW